MKYYQGDIIKIEGFNNLFIIVSKNAFIDLTRVFHVCPVLEGVAPGPIHIPVKGKDEVEGTVICEQLKMIDPEVRSCKIVDRVAYDMVMNVSDTIQGIFEYD